MHTIDGRHQAGHAGAASRFGATPIRASVQYRIGIVKVAIVKELRSVASAEHVLNGGGIGGCLLKGNGKGEIKQRESHLVNSGRFSIHRQTDTART